MFVKCPIPIKWGPFNAILEAEGVHRAILDISEILSGTKESLVISRRLREFFLKLSQYKAFIDKGVSKFGIFLKSGIFNTSKNLQMAQQLIDFVDILLKIGDQHVSLFWFNKKQHMRNI